MIIGHYGSLGSEYFLNLAMEGHVLIKTTISASSLVWNALLTEKLSTFLSRLHEINGGHGCEKILPVSGPF